MSLYDRPLNSALPLQQVSYKTKFLDKKDKNGFSKWQKDTMDALEAFGRYAFYNNIELRKNYEIMQGRFNVEDYIDSFDAYDLSSMIYQEMKLPSFLKHYDITTKAVKLLQGEFIKRPDITRVVARDPETSNEKLRLKSELIWSYINDSIDNEITRKLYSQGIDPNKNDFNTEEEANEYKKLIQQKYQELTPQSIEKYLTYDFRSAGEHWGNATLKDDIERFRIKEKDVEEFYDMCVVDRAFSHLYLTPSGYAIERWNPLNVFYQYNTQNKNIEDLAFCGRILYMSKTEIIDYFGWRMTQSQQEALYPDYQKGEAQGSVYKEAFNATLYPFADYREYDTLVSSIGQAVAETSMGASPFGIPQFGFYPGTDGSNYVFTQSDIVQVTQAYWKSQRKIGKVNIQNPETGAIEVQIVDETFEPELFGIEEVKESYKDSDEPNTICWSWISETWQGIKVSVNYQKNQTSDDRNAIYIDIKPCEFQFRGNDPRFIQTSKLPVVGSIFNNMNGRSQAVVDLLKPYQILVNAFYNQAYHVAQKNNGKFFIMGASLLPNVKDWGGEEAQEKFMTIASNLGLAVVDDSTNAQSASMQYGLKVMDMDESDRITRLINLAMLVEQQGFMQLGITPQRQGSIQASETATGTETAVNNSYAITEIYFEQFSNYRRRKLQMMLEMAQYVESQGEGDIVKEYTTSDLGRAFIKINKLDLLLKDIGVYLMNSAEQQRKKDLIEQLLLKNNQSLMPLSKLIETIRLDSLADIQKKLEEQEAQQMKQAQAAQEKEMQMEQAKIEAEAVEKQKDREKDIYIAELKVNADLQKTTLQGIANEGSYDPNINNTDLLIKQRDLYIKENQANQQASLQRMQLTNQMLDSYQKSKLEKEKMNSEKQLKQKEAKNKEVIENKKIQAIQIQNKSQEKINKEANDAKLKLVDKQLEMKNLEMKMKQLEISNAKNKSNIEINHLKKKIELEEDLNDVKAESIKKLNKVKEEESKKVSDIKVKQTEEISKIKVKEAKQKIKIKPKINKK